jgi:hypothetical protein
MWLIPTGKIASVPRLHCEGWCSRVNFEKFYRSFDGRFAAAGTVAFFVLGFVFRLLSNYTREGNFDYSAQNAALWTTVSLVVFVGLLWSFHWLKDGQSSRRVFWLEVTALSALYVSLFYAFYWFDSKALLLTLKFQGILLVEDGNFTLYGSLIYLAIGFLDCMFSVLSLAVCFPKLVPSIHRQAGAWPQ